MNNALATARPANETAGSKYISGRKGPEIAKLIRADIKAAAKADGTLKGCNVSVRFRWATHSMAIDVVVKSTPAAILNPERVAALAADPYTFSRLPRYTPAGDAILAACERIANEYNYRDSDPMTDYYNDTFFLDVKFDHDLVSAQERAILRPAPVHPRFCACHECDAVGAACG